MPRREYDEGYEDARREMQEKEFGSSRGRGDNSFTAAIFIKYLSLVIIVVIVAYVVLQVLGGIQRIFPGG